MYMAAAVLVGIGLSTVLVITAGSSANPPAFTTATVNVPNPSSSVPSVSPTRQAVTSPKVKVHQPKTSNTDKTDQKQQPITVVMQIENGRVLNASVANHKPGRDNYEAMALRIARQRRYATTVSGGQTVTISVNPQE
jgi:hypothetical protein